MFGRLARKVLYGPADLDNKMCVLPRPSHSQEPSREYSTEAEYKKLRKVRLSFRKFANYRFLFYFFLCFVMTKTFSGFSSILNLMIIFFVSLFVSFLIN